MPLLSRADLGPRACTVAMWLVLAAVAGCGARRDDPMSGAGTVRVLEARPLPTATYAGEIGTADPVRVIASARSGRWIIACQARRDTDGDGRIRVVVGTDSLEGDAMAPYLFRGAGDGQAIEAFIARSPDDRWLSVVRDGQLVLVDDVRGTESIVRDAEVRPDLRGIAGLAAFDGESRRLVYFRRAEDRRVVVVRDLTASREQEIRLPRPVARLLADRQGTWAALWFVPPARPGVLRRGPGTISPEAAMGQTCGTGAGYATIDDDRARDAWLRLDTGQLDADPSVLGHLGGRAMMRGVDGADGRRVDNRTLDHEHALREASGRVLAVDVRGRALVGAAIDGADHGDQALGPLRWVTPAGY